MIRRKLLCKVGAKRSPIEKQGFAERCRSSLADIAEWKEQDFPIARQERRVDREGGFRYTPSIETIIDDRDDRNDSKDGPLRV
jgi:hypothetical protein